MRKHPISINGVEFDEILVAENYPDMKLGLGKLDSLDEKSGLIYVFFKRWTHAWENNNPHFPIDLVLMNDDGVVVDVLTLQPNEKTKRSKLPYLYALEIRGGMASKIGLKQGMPTGIDLKSLTPYRNSYNNASWIVPKNIPLPDGWYEAAKQEISRRDALGNDLFELNIALVGAKYDLAVLRSQGWKKLGDNSLNLPIYIFNSDWSTYWDTSRSSDLWMESTYMSKDSRFILRLFCSAAGHFRYMYAVELDKTGVFKKKTSAKLPSELKRRLLELFNGAMIEPAPKDVDKELDRVIRCLDNAPTLEGWDTRRRQLYLWIHEFDNLRKDSPYFCHRLLNGMLRFGSFCEDEEILADTIKQTLTMRYEPGLIRLLDIILQRPIIASADLWNSIGCVLDRLDMRESALFCFISAWRNHYSELYGKNIWLMGSQLLPDYFRKRDRVKAALVADAMIASIPKDCDTKWFVEILCAMGMTYEMEENTQMAVECYSAARAVLCSDKTDDGCRKEKDTEQNDGTLTFHDHPLLFQSMSRVTMQDAAARRKQLEQQLDCYPDVPDSTKSDDDVSVSCTEDAKCDGSHNLFLASPKSGITLEYRAMNAINKRNGVENIVRFENALACDPNLSCTINGANVFIKLFTGYYISEEVCRMNVARALLNTPCRWHGSECRLAVVAGIRSHRREKCSNIFYLGMAGDDDDWQAGLYEFLGVDLTNLHKIAEDKKLKIHGTDKTVSQLLHCRYDFCGEQNDSQNAQDKKSLVMKVMQAWEKLDASVFQEVLAERGFAYASFWVHDIMEGKRAYCDYIEKKFASISRTNCAPKVSMVRLIEGIEVQKYPFALHMSQRNHSTLLTFDFNDARITGMYMTDPDIYAFEFL